MLINGAVWFGVSFGRNSDAFETGIADKVMKSFELHTDGWGTVEIAEGVYDFFEIDSYVALLKKYNKKLAIRLQCAGHHFAHFPQWARDKYGIRTITQDYKFADFEHENIEGYNILQGHITSNNAICGKYSLEFSGVGDFIKTNFQIKNTNNHSLGFDIKVISESELNIKVGKTIFFSEKLLLIQKSFMLTIPKEILDNEPDIIFSLSYGSIIIDNIKLSEDKLSYANSVVSFPNYFDNNFKTLYINFLMTLKEKYKSERVVDTIVVGGFGRWDEVTLLADPVNASDNNLLKQQWIAYGYTDEKYVEHICWCMDIHKQIFGDTDKNLLVHTIGYEVPGDTHLVNWKISNYAAQNGFIIKTNGISERFSEWDDKNNVFQYISNRYKFDLKTPRYLEEGAQIHNVSMGHIMGHPHSLLNRMLIDNTCCFWSYASDLFSPFVKNYLHYFNEQAGSCLMNRFFNIPSIYNLNIEKNSQTHSIRLVSEWTGIILKKDELYDFDEIQNKPCVSTSDKTDEILYGLDDRQKLNGLYGSALTLEYYDNDGEFEVFVAIPDGTMQGKYSLLGNVKKTGTNTFKLVSFYNSDWTNDKRSGLEDIFCEVKIKNTSSEKLSISYVELSTVPVREYKQSCQNTITTDLNFVTTDNKIAFSVDFEIRPSFIDIPFKELSDGYVLINCDVYFEGKLIIQKELFMPGDFSYVHIPLSLITAQKGTLKIELSTLIGSAAVLTNSEGIPAYTLNNYAVEKLDNITLIKDNKVYLNALRPFACITTLKSTNLTIEKILSDNTKIKIYSGVGRQHEFEPQSDGKYIISSDIDTVAQPEYLVRRMTPNKPTYYELPENVIGTLSFDNKDYFYGEITDKKIIFEYNFENFIEASNQVFSFYVMNSSSCSIARLWWKTDKEYSVIIPIVPNDTERRQYTVNLSVYKNYFGTLSKIWFTPIANLTDTGMIKIDSVKLFQKECL